MEHKCPRSAIKSTSSTARDGLEEEEEEAVCKGQAEELRWRHDARCWR